MVDFNSTYEENSTRLRPERLVLSHLRQFGATARADLARQLGLSPATVSAATAALAARGVLREIADDPVSPLRNLRGRPSVRLDFAPGAGTVASLRVGYARAELALADARGSLRAPVVEELALRGRSAEEVCAVLAGFDDRALAALHAPRVEALAVAFQGFVDAERGVVVWSPVLDCRNVALATALRAHLDCPVAVENDAGALALGLAWRDRRHARGRTAAILLGEGVGLGLLFDGKLYRGVRAGGSEYGHIRIGAHGPQCRCGARGCIEATIADYALYRDVRLALGTPAAAPASESEMAELVARAAAGDARAAAVFDAAAQVLAEGVSILLQLLQPENVVVAGPGVRARALLEPALRRHLAQLATPGILDHTTVEFADFEPVQFLEGALRRGLEMLDDSLAARGS
jgi:predicted NBD/HSP70 family sugar kinase